MTSSAATEKSGTEWSGAAPAEARFADLLLTASLVNRHELNVAAEHAKRHQVPLAEAVVQLDFITEQDSYTVLAGATGLRLIDLSKVTPSASALRFAPARVTHRHILLPLDEDNRMLTCAVSQSFDDEAERDVAWRMERAAA